MALTSAEHGRKQKFSQLFLCPAWAVYYIWSISAFTLTLKYLQGGKRTAKQQETKDMGIYMLAAELLHLGIFYCFTLTLKNFKVLKEKCNKLYL